MKKKILVTGAAGFLGSNLCKKLLEQGYAVTGLDDLSSGSLRNIEELEKYQSFKFIKHDIVNPIDLEVDQIYNLACPASPPRYQADPIQTTKTSVIGSLNLLELARKHRSRILQASTSEVYGDPEQHPQVEEYRGHVNPIGIRACYDEGKRCAESLFFDYHRLYGLEIKVVRIFNTYGPNMDPDDGRVVSNFIVRALKREPLQVYGDGNQTRSFCYVDDLIAGLIAMMNSPVDVVGPINLGNPSEFSVAELARIVLNLTGSSSKLVHQKLPDDDPTRRRPNIDKAKELLGWEPKVKLAEGLEKTVEYFNSIVPASSSVSSRAEVEVGR